jgi:hypothetical protein
MKKRNNNNEKTSSPHLENVCVYEVLGNSYGDNYVAFRYKASDGYCPCVCVRVWVCSVRRDVIP